MHISCVRYFYFQCSSFLFLFFSFKKIKHQNIATCLDSKKINLLALIFIEKFRENKNIVSSSAHCLTSMSNLILTSMNNLPQFFIIQKARSIQLEMQTNWLNLSFSSERMMKSKVEYYFLIHCFVLLIQYYFFRERKAFFPHENTQEIVIRP